MRRKLWPMPIAGIVDHPAAIAMQSAAYGALVRLCHHFWMTDCRPLPTNDRLLRQLARAHVPTWAHHKREVMQVFSDVRPELERAFSARRNRTDALRIVALRGGAKKTALAAQKRMADSISPTEARTHHDFSPPKKEPATPRPAPPEARPKRPVRVDRLTLR